MELPDDILLRSPGEAARRIALGLLDQARAAAEDWLDPENTDALHRFRVAIRRLRCTLRAWDDELRGDVRKKHHRALRAIQSATGTGRDAEVGLFWLANQAPTLDAAQNVGQEWIAARIGRRLADCELQPRELVRGRFEDLERDLRPRLERMRVEVHLTRPQPRPRFGAALAARLREHLEQFNTQLAGLSSPAEREEAHRARIRLKRLRYLIEPAAGHVEGLRAVIDDCKTLQDLLGELNDLHVLGSQIDAALEPARGGANKRAPKSARAGLLELTLRAEARREAIFVELERAWLGPRSADFNARVERVSVALDAAARADFEIERKYLLNGMPTLPPAALTIDVEQGWLPGKRLRERVRRVSRDGELRYFRALKAGRGLTRMEFEEETTQEVFDALWPLTAGCRVHKRRSQVADGALVWEIDAFNDRELWLAEVELPDEAALAPPPAWLAPFIVREVTDEKGFTNLELAGP